MAPDRSTGDGETRRPVPPPLPPLRVAAVPPPLPATVRVEGVPAGKQQPPRLPVVRGRSLPPAARPESDSSLLLSPTTVAVVFGAVVVGCVVVGVLPPAKRATPSSIPVANASPTVEASSGPLSGEEVYRKLVRSTAFILGTDQVGQQTRLTIGSGVLVHGPRRLVLTNYHVVGTRDSAIVFFPAFPAGPAADPNPNPAYYVENADRLGVRATVLARSPRQDLAVLALASDPPGVPALPLARGSAAVGSKLYSVGAAGIEVSDFSGTLWRLSTGEVRGRNRWTYRFPDQAVDAVFLENQKPINYGDSGGPTVNDRCALVGLVSMKDPSRDAVRRDVDLLEVRVFLADVARQGGWAWDEVTAATPRPVGSADPAPPPVKAERPAVEGKPPSTRPAPPIPEPASLPDDPAAVATRAKVALGEQLAGTKWTWPDRSVRKPWFVLNPNQTLTPAWHAQIGSWEVTSPTTIQGVIMSTPRTPQTFLVDLEAGTLTNVRSREVHRLMK